MFPPQFVWSFLLTQRLVICLLTIKTNTQSDRRGDALWHAALNSRWNFYLVSGGGAQHLIYNIRQNTGNLWTRHTAHNCLSRLSCFYDLYMTVGSQNHNWNWNSINCPALSGSTEKAVYKFSSNTKCSLLHHYLISCWIKCKKFIINIFKLMSFFMHIKV